MTTPRVKTEATSVESPKSKCGDNWDKNIKVRNPYKGVDKFFRSLLSIAESELVVARADEIPGQLEWEHARVKKLRGDHKLILNSEQRKNIDTYLERARLYIKDSTKIQKLWASGFATVGYGVVKAFPIHINVSDIGNGFCLAKPPGYQAKNKYEFDCPRLEEVQGHNKDAEKWSALIVAAMKNVRCAEEVIRKEEVLQLNKTEWEKAAPQSQIERLGIIRIAEAAVERQPIPIVSDEAGRRGSIVAGRLVGDEMPDAIPVSEDLPSPGELPMVAEEEDIGEGVLEEEMPETAPEPRKKRRAKGP